MSRRLDVSQHLANIDFEIENPSWSLNALTEYVSDHLGHGSFGSMQVTRRVSRKVTARLPSEPRSVVTTIRRRINSRLSVTGFGIQRTGAGF